MFNQKATTALEAAARAGALVISPFTYVELLAVPGKTRLWMDEFLHDVGIAVDWEIEEATWLEAGEAFAAYAQRRRRSGEAPRRILADFVIGAHALRQANQLLTADDWYKTIYKGLKLVVVR
jgi:predicted nucleic acid-binding protein